MNASELYAKGIPVAGHAQLDQSQWFIEAHNFYQSEYERHANSGK